MNRIQNSKFNSPNNKFNNNLNSNILNNNSNNHGVIEFLEKNNLIKKKMMYL